MKRKTFFLFLIFFASGRIHAQDIKSNLLVKEEASRNVLTFLNLIPEGSEISYGFSNRSDFSKIKIEEPYQTYYVANKNNTLNFISGNEWRLPISVDDKFVALLTVQINSGKAEVVDFGGNMLAKKIQEFEKLYPNKQSQHILIRNTFLNHDYIPLDFTSLYKSVDNPPNFLIDTQSNQLIYQLNEAEPLKISISNFCMETMEIINNSKETK